MAARLPLPGARTAPAPFKGARLLRIDFINVGDGDAVLAREFIRQRLIYTLLVDCGRETVPPLLGSRRLSAPEYLRAQGLESIDLMLITHLHPDHFGGMLALAGIPVRRVIAGYIPSRETASVIGKPRPSSSHSTRGMYASLTAYVEGIRRMRGSSCLTEEAAKIPLSALTRRLTMSIHCPDKSLLARQKAVFGAMESGKRLPEAILYAVSKERNQSSLRITLTYAGRRILLPGDAYGAYWEDEQDARRCDILKLPHHGDEKSLTPALMQRLRPSHAVITGLMGDSGKHRPSKKSVALLKRWRVQISSLENEKATELPRASHQAIVFLIRESGRIRRRIAE